MLFAIGGNMGTYKAKALDFLYGVGFLDEIRYNGKQMIIRAKNPEITGTVVVQGDEHRGYEFLVFYGREDFESFGAELEECGLTPKYHEMEENEKMSFRARFYNPEVPPVHYEIKVDEKRKCLFVEKLQNESSISTENEM